MKEILLILLVSVSLKGMEQENSREQAKKIIKQLVQEAIEEKERSYENSGVIVARPIFIKAEVDTGPIHIDDEKGIMVADGKVFIVDYKNQAITKKLQMQSRIELSHNAGAAIVAVTAIKNMVGAAHTTTILLGEDKGRILVLDPEDCQFRTLGQVPGRILSFAINRKGDRIAVRFTGKDSEGLPVPCFALSAAYLQKQNELKTITDSEKRRSWRSINNWQWTEFFTEQCKHEVKAITVKKKYCITECATGYLEKWKIKHASTNPRLKCIKKTKIEEGGKRNV